MAWRFVPNFKPKGRQKLEYWGALSLFISLLALLLALTVGQEAGFSSPPILLLFGVSAISLAIFLGVEWNTEQPMIDLKMFRNILFSVNLVTGFITFLAISGVFILMPFYLENVLGYDTRQTGLLLAVLPIGLGVMAPIAGSLSDRFGSRPITLAGLLVLLASYWGLTTLSLETTTLGYVLHLLPLGIGMGIFQSPNNSAIMGTVPRERLGIASGLLSITRTLGQTVGIAVLGAFWASRVMTYTGEALSGGATTAPQMAQVAGLHDTYMISTGLLVLGVILSVWGLFQERRLRRLTVAQADSRP
jgi:MFS family permease